VTELLTEEEFVRIFDRFEHTAFRLETRIAVAHGVVNAACRAGFVAIWCDHTVPGAVPVDWWADRDGSAGLAVR
jgi:hypothetical protein